MTTTVVNVRDEPFDVYIGRARGSVLGNPFRIGRNGDREMVIKSFRSYARDRMASDPEFAATVRALRGLRLGCHCKPLACHGDVYVELVDG